MFRHENGKHIRQQPHAAPPRFNLPALGPASVNVRLALSWMAVGIIIFITMLPTRRIAGDDVNFAAQLRNTPTLEWLVQRYQTWSGRLFSDATAAVILQTDDGVWYVANTAMLLLLLYSITKLAFGSITVDGLWFSFAVFCLIDPGILTDSVYWTVGSVNYLWPAALGMYSALLLRNIYTNISNPAYHNAIYIVCGFCASLGVEQVSGCLFVLGIIVTLSVLLNRHTINWWGIAYTIVIGIGVGIVLLCPGSRVRQVEDAQRWYPEFLTMSFLDKIRNGVIWQFQYVAQYTSVILVAASFILLVSSHQRNGIAKYLGLISASCASIYLLSATLPSMSDLHSLLAFQNNDVFFVLKYMPYVFWSLLIGSLFVGMSLLSDAPFIVFFLLLGSQASAALMYFSPTIYASGPRSMFIPVLLILTVLLMTIRSIGIHRHKEYGIIVVPLATVSACMVISLYCNVLAHGFIPHAFW